MHTKPQHSHNKTPPEHQVQAIVQRLKLGKMPRSDSKLGLLLRDVEAGLIADMGGEPNTAELIKIGLVLQHAVLVAGLPLFDAKGDTHPSYRWAVEDLQKLLDGLYKAKPTKKRKTKSPAAIVQDIEVARTRKATR